MMSASDGNCRRFCAPETHQVTASAVQPEIALDKSGSSTLDARLASDLSLVPLRREHSLRPLRLLVVFAPSVSMMRQMCQFLTLRMMILLLLCLMILLLPCLMNSKVLLVHLKTLLVHLKMFLRRKVMSLDETKQHCLLLMCHAWMQIAVRIFRLETTAAVRSAFGCLLYHTAFFVCGSFERQPQLIERAHFSFEPTLHLDSFYFLLSLR